jgi:tRNA A37 threonylcarbamoyladenosine biosynthesis protein TsaE
MPKTAFKVGMSTNKNYFQFTLNSQQSTIFEELKGFSNNQDNVFILKGYAGTGKTTLMSGFIKYLKDF